MEGSICFHEQLLPTGEDPSVKIILFHDSKLLEWGWNAHAETNYASAKGSQKGDPFLIFDLTWCHLSSEASSGVTFRVKPRVKPREVFFGF